MNVRDARLERAPPPLGTIADGPFTVVRPTGVASPLVCASPHSGRCYPPDLMEASALDAAAIRGSEDAFVDELIATAPRHGASLILANYARAYVDLNRDADELDPSMYEDPLPGLVQARSARVTAGLGSIPRVVSEGREIYSRKLRAADAARRLDTVHRPYHAALQHLLAEAKVAFSCAVLLDWHSMPSAAARAGTLNGPDMVLGDRYGAACAPAVAQRVERALQTMGYTVVRNAPYAGGYSTETYGRPAEGVHALQIEINRALYLDERAVRPGRGFQRLADDLDRLFAALCGADWRALT